MKNLSFIFLIFSTILLGSCISLNKGFQTYTVQTRSVEHDPVKADIKIDTTKRLWGISTSSYFLFFRVSGDNTYADGINYSVSINSNSKTINPFKMHKQGIVERVKSSAAYHALSKGEYDFIINPNYTMTIKNYLGIYKIYQANVTGYGAKYTNLRTEKQKIIIVGGKEYMVTDDDQK